MKNSKKLVRKISIILVSIIAFTLLMSLPTFAADLPSVPQIELNPDFNPNIVIKSIVSVIAIIIFIIGIVAGIVQMAMGKTSEKNEMIWTGFGTIVFVVILSGAMIAIVNMVIK